MSNFDLSSFLGSDSGRNFRCLMAKKIMLPFRGLREKMSPDDF